MLGTPGSPLVWNSLGIPQGGADERAGLAAFNLESGHGEIETQNLDIKAHLVPLSAMSRVTFH